MRRHAVLVSTSLALAACLLACARRSGPHTASPPHPATEAIPDVPWGEPFAGLRTRLVPLQSEFVLGKPMRFRIELRNDGAKAVSFSDYNRPANYLEVTLPDGTKAACIGDDTLSQFIVEQTIAPGQVLVLQDELDVSALYHLTGPGSYRLRFRGEHLAADGKSLPEGDACDPFTEFTDPILPAPNHVRLPLPSNIVEIMVAPR